MRCALLAANVPQDSFWTTRMNALTQIFALIWKRKMKNWIIIINSYAARVIAAAKCSSIFCTQFGQNRIFNNLTQSNEY